MRRTPTRWTVVPLRPRQVLLAGIVAAVVVVVVVALTRDGEEPEAGDTARPAAGGAGAVESIDYPGGGRYEGGVEDGEPHGRGTRTYPNGSRLEGVWDGGRLEGGTFVYPRGEVFELESTKPRWIASGRFDYIVEDAAGADGVAVSSYRGGVIILPELDHPLPHGRGSARFAHGVRYAGRWKDGRMSGEGTFTYLDGSTYTGGVRHAGGFDPRRLDLHTGKPGGLPHGEGTFQFASTGVACTGRWVHGRLEGEGTIRENDGTERRETWIEGRVQGRLWPDVMIYHEMERPSAPR